MSGTISAIADLISRPAFWVCIVLLLIYCIFMAWVDTLDAPTPDDSKMYKHSFRFLNRLAFRLKRAEVLAHIPQDDDKADAAGVGK